MLQFELRGFLERSGLAFGLTDLGLGSYFESAEGIAPVVIFAVGQRVQIKGASNGGIHTESHWGRREFFRVARGDRSFPSLILGIDFESEMAGHSGGDGYSGVYCLALAALGRAQRNNFIGTRDENAPGLTVGACRSGNGIVGRKNPNKITFIESGERIETDRKSNGVPRFGQTVVETAVEPGAVVASSFGINVHFQIVFLSLYRIGIDDIGAHGGSCGSCCPCCFPAIAGITDKLGRGMSRANALRKIGGRGILGGGGEGCSEPNGQNAQSGKKVLFHGCEMMG